MLPVQKCPAWSLAGRTRGRSTSARLPGPGLVSFQVQCSQQEAAGTQRDGEGTAQKAVLQAEEVLQVGVGALSLQDTGDLP